MNYYRSYNLKIGNAKCEVFENCGKFMAFIAQKKLLFVVDYYKCLIIFTTKLMVQGIQLSLFFFTIDACHFHSLEKLHFHEPFFSSMLTIFQMTLHNINHCIYMYLPFFCVPFGSSFSFFPPFVIS